MNQCVFNIEPFCSDVCGDHRRPQTLAEICRNVSICCGFRAVATREKYPGFILLKGQQNLLLTKPAYLWSYPGYFWEPHGLPEISRLTSQVWTNTTVIGPKSIRWLSDLQIDCFITDEHKMFLNNSILINEREKRLIWSVCVTALAVSEFLVCMIWSPFGHIRSSPPLVLHICHWTESALVQAKACHLVGTKPLPEPMLTHCEVDP